MVGPDGPVDRCARPRRGPARPAQASSRWPTCSSRTRPRPVGWARTRPRTLRPASPLRGTRRRTRRRGTGGVAGLRCGAALVVESVHRCGGSRRCSRTDVPPLRGGWPLPCRPDGWQPGRRDPTTGRRGILATRRVSLAWRRSQLESWRR